MAGNLPEIVWLQPKSKKPPAIGCAVTIACLCLIAFLGKVGGGGTERGFWAAILTNPLTYFLGFGALWGLVFFCENDASASTSTVRWKCPHCGHTADASDALRKGVLESVWSCSECNNAFRKGTAPP
jgi:hypothetical protein